MITEATSLLKLVLRGRLSKCIETLARVRTTPDMGVDSSIESRGHSVVSRHVASRRVIIVVIVIVSTLLPLLGALRTPLVAQAVLLDHTEENVAAGNAGSWDLSGADLTYKSLLREIWVLDPHCDRFPQVKIFAIDQLNIPPSSRPILLPPDLEGATVLGIAENVHAPDRDQNFVLIDSRFDTEADSEPRIGLIDNRGILVEGSAFERVFGLDDDSQLSSIDVNEEREEIVGYDINLHALWVLDFSLEVLDGPIPLLGGPSYFVGEWQISQPGCSGRGRGAGFGICWDGPRSVLVTTGFTTPFESHLALRYEFPFDDPTFDAARYSGQAIDLSAAANTEFAPDLSFLSIDKATVVDEPMDGEEPRENVSSDSALIALNLADEALYLFEYATERHATSVRDLTCFVIDVGERGTAGRYRVTWDLELTAGVEALSVFENGARIDQLAPEMRSFTSLLPVSGKIYIEVVTESGGRLSALRPFCELENSFPPRLLSDEPIFGATRVSGFSMTGCAVTPTPASESEFRAYLIGRGSNLVRVFDHTLTEIDTIRPEPPVVRVGRNDAALGIALVDIDGVAALAILDSDGPDDDNVPALRVHSLESVPPGQRIRSIDAIDLSEVSPRPFLFDLDSDVDGNLIAGGRLADGRFVLVRLVWYGSDGLRAVAQVETPFASLTPSGATNGIGVSVLPSGHLLVAGGDSFQSSYSEALLLTPFRGDLMGGTSNGGPRLVGFAVGLRLPGEFFRGFGPALGPGLIFGLDVAWFGASTENDEDGNGRRIPESVCFLPTVDIEMLRNPAADEVLEVDGDVFLSAGAGEVLAHPRLVADQIFDETVNLEAGDSEVFEGQTGRFEDLESPDLSLWVFNRDPQAPILLELSASLDGDPIEELPRQLLIEPGRYFRAVLEERAGSSLEVDIANRGTASARVRVLVGARGIDLNEPPPDTRFRRGDCDADGVVSITDGIFGLGLLFLGGEPTSCFDACDSDDSGLFNLSDALGLLHFLFAVGEVPRFPGPTLCGVDPTFDELPVCDYDALSTGCL
jgi:hypothetical protein